MYMMYHKNNKTKHKYSQDGMFCAHIGDGKVEESRNAKKENS